MTQDGRALVVSPQAYALGVRRGMRAGGIRALAPETQLLERDHERERAVQDGLVLALLRFTPNIALAEDFGILMEVGRSLMLFGGAHRLAQQVRACARTLGIRVVIGAAPTAVGAWLLARRPRRGFEPVVRRCLRMERLKRLLDRLPCLLLPEAKPHTAWMDGVGAVHLGALRRLPRSGLKRRTSAALVDTLDLAYGERIELHRWLAIAETFDARLELFGRIEHADALLDGAAKLVLQMTGWLQGSHKAVCQFVLLMEHERGRTAIAPTPLEVALAEPAWQSEHLLRLLRERLAKLPLQAPAIGLRLITTHLEAMVPQTASLFPEAGGSSSDMLRLMELLTARLGHENVLLPQPLADHRPEVCNVWVSAAAKPRKIEAPPDDLARPFWLLAQPIRLLLRDMRPFYGGPLALIRGPERIEAGWWFDDTAARDYYVAQGQDAACFWIYQERGGAMEWYLHGLFA